MNTKTLIAALAATLITAAIANANPYAVCANTYYPQCRTAAGGYAVYGQGYCGGGGAYYGGYGYGSSSFGNQYGQWGNGQGATLSSIASIVAAAAPVLVANRPQVVEVPVPTPVAPPIQLVNGTPCYIINGKAYPVKQ